MSWDPETKQCTIERNDHNLAIPDFTFHQKDQMTLITGSTDMSATVNRIEVFPNPLLVNDICLV